jgi:hypothetical protein
MTLYASLGGKMHKSIRSFVVLTLLVCASVLSGCTNTDNSNNNATTTNDSQPPTVSPAEETLTVVDRPQAVKDMQAARGEQEQAQPILKFVTPTDGSTVNSSKVELKLALSGDLKGYKPMKDPATGMGNHIHVILDNQPYEAYYNLDQPFELRNVTDGEHTIRVFASRPWHESYKNEGNFQMVKFTVKQGGGDASKPTTTRTGEKMADNKKASPSPTPAAAAEGKDYPPSQAGAVDRAKPLLTYSRPKGEYKGADTNAIMIDFWLSGAKLKADGGEYRVRYTINDGVPKYIDTWAPIWLSGWVGGKHQLRLELIGPDGNPVDNGGYNTTSREITVTK